MIEPYEGGRGPPIPHRGYNPGPPFGPAARPGRVSAVLINAGVNPQRIRSIGRGEDAPIASNLTPEGRSLNRRVEITITPTG